MLFSQNRSCLATYYYISFPSSISKRQFSLSCSILDLQDGYMSGSLHLALLRCFESRFMRSWPLRAFWLRLAGPHKIAGISFASHCRVIWIISPPTRLRLPIGLRYIRPKACFHLNCILRKTTFLRVDPFWFHHGAGRNFIGFYWCNPCLLPYKVHYQLSSLFTVIFQNKQWSFLDISLLDFILSSL